MPDIRVILSSLEEEDRLLWSQTRTRMRQSYLSAHNTVLGIDAWDHSDDAFMDLIDIRLALLFDRAGRINSTSQIVEQKEEAAIIQQNHEAEDVMKAKEPIEKSDASKLLNQMSHNQNGDGWK